jgi:hypothetical protein
MLWSPLCWRVCGTKNDVPALLGFLFRIPYETTVSRVHRPWRRVSGSSVELSANQVNGVSILNHGTVWRRAQHETGCCLLLPREAHLKRNFSRVLDYANDNSANTRRKGCVGDIYKPACSPSFVFSRSYRAHRAFFQNGRGSNPCSALLFCAEHTIPKSVAEITMSLGLRMMSASGRLRLAKARVRQRMESLS